MPRKPRDNTRAPNMTSSVYGGADGYWHGRVTMGVRDDGKPDRRHVMGSESDVRRKVRELERARDDGNVRKPGKPWTVERWLTHWIDNIAPNGLRESSLSAYAVAVRVHLVPGLGAHRLDRLQPEHLERLYSKMMRAGSKPATAHQAHRTIRTALGEAVRRGHITRNVAAIAKPPSLSDQDEVDPYTVEEVKRLLETAGERRNSARWAIALALGLRQGEALGLKWSDVDLDAGTLRVRRARQRPKYAHGCSGGCGREHAGYCPSRIALRPATADTKSRAGRRGVGLPDEIVALLQKHRQEQEHEKHLAAQLWHDEGWLFATPTGRPLNPNTDYHEWKKLLIRAGIRDGALHHARHTAATALLLLGVPDRTVMGLMGWSNTTMAGRYQHITEQIRRDVAKRVGGLLWDSAASAPDDPPETGSREDES